jgi:hypothetical protein
MNCVNIFAPDSLIACRTPLIKGGGSDPWTNSGSFVDADLSVNGLKGDGVGKYLNTGFNPSVSSTNNNDGLTCYVSEVDDTIYPQAPVGIQFGGGAVNMIYQNGGGYYGFIETVTQPAGWGMMVPGLWSTSRSSGTDLRLSYGGPFAPYNELATNSTLQANGEPNGSIYAMCQNLNTVASSFFKGRVSFIAMHKALTLAEGSALYDAVVQLRISLGGGLGTTTNVATMWSARVVANGGAAPGSTSLTAAETFYKTLVSSGLINKINCCNFFSSDNLTAARTAFIRGIASDPWANSGSFVVGDLTVDGLKGDGVGKYLNTGFNPSTMANSVIHGMSVYIHTLDGVTTFGPTLGIQFGAGQVNVIAQQQTSTNGYITTVTQPAFTATVRAGFWSASRLTTTDLKLYAANSTNAFAQMGSNAVNQANGQPNANVFCFAQNLAGAPNQFYQGRLSAALFHSGLTSSETQTLYDAVQALRVGLGGGWV